ncbi:MAG: hypothetical protein ABIG28_02315 [archaeon]
MSNTKTMTQKNLLVFLVTVLAIAFAVQSVSAAITVDKVLVNGIDGNVANGVIAGELLEVEVFVSADTKTYEDVTVEAWISSDKGNSVETRKFPLSHNAQSHREILKIKVPSDTKPEENLKLKIYVESEDGTSSQTEVNLVVDRESYLLEILAVDAQPEVKAGESLVMDVVLKNRGRQSSEDTFLRVRIPELGLETQTYFGDLSPVDQSSPDKEDALERRTYLRIPANAPVGLYDVVIEAFNDESFTTMSKRILVAGAEEDTMIVTPSTTKTFAVDETGTYKLTIVNRGSTIRVYDVVLDAPEGLNLDISDSVIVVPAGSSRTIEITANSDTRDDYSFTAIVSSEGKIVTDESFTAHVTESDGKKTTSGTATDNTAVLLTVILAIVFVVLLVVLIVLLTRKPEKIDESGESYY